VKRITYLAPKLSTFDGLTESTEFNSTINPLANHDKSNEI